jgi:GNAT superfamily N-acetyltransferase
MQAELREAAPTDLKPVVELLERQLDDNSVRPEGAVLSEATRRLLEDGSLGRILIAEVGGRPVGLAVLAFVWTLEHGGRSAWLDELYVEPAHRERGIGRALLLAAIDLAASAGARAIDLEVEPEHERAAHLYEREGFRPHCRSRWVRSLLR